MVAKVENTSDDAQPAQIFAGMEFLILPAASRDAARKEQEEILQVGRLHT